VGRTPSDFEDAGAGTGAVIAVKRPGGAGVSGISGSRLNEVGEKLEGGGVKSLDAWQGRQEQDSGIYNRALLGRTRAFNAAI